MKRLPLLLALAAVSSSCALFQKVAREVDPLKQYREPAEKKCGPLQDMAVSSEEEREIGGAIALGLAQKTGGLFIELSADLPKEPLSPDTWKDKKVAPPTGDRAQLTAYLNRVGRYLAQFSERPPADGRPEFRWTFVVLDSPSKNAFSAPGGYVFVTTGLLKATGNEAQLAAVLAHEIGHVTARDSITAYKAGKYEACKLVVLLAEASKVLPDLDANKLPAPEGWRKALGSLSRAEQRKVAEEFTAAATGTSFNPSRASGAFVGFLTDVVISIINTTGYAKESEFRADATADRLLTYAGYERSQFQVLLKTLPDGGGISPHPSNGDRVHKLDALQKSDTDFAGKAAPDNAEQLKVVKK